MVRRRAMALRQPLLLGLLCLGAVTAEQYGAVSGDVGSNQASPKLDKCQFSKKELHTTVRSAAVSALTGICDPVEMESRLLGMEQRLKHRIEELKETLTKLFIDGVAYDYEEEGDTALEQHRYTGAASAASAAETAASAAGGSTVAGRGSGTKDAGAGAGGSGATLTQHGGFEAYNKIETSADARRTTSSARSESERRTTSSAGAEAGAGAGAAGAGAAGAQQAGFRAGSSHSYSSKWSNSSRSQGSSADSHGADISAGEARASADRRSSSGAAQKVRAGGAAGTGTAASAEDGASVGGGDQSAGSRRSSSRGYSYKWSTASRGSSGEGSADQSRGEASRSGGASSQEGGVEEEPGQHGGSGGSSSHRHSHERRTSSSRGSSGSVAREIAQEARAIGGAGYSEGADSQSHDATRSGSRGHSYERGTSSSSRTTSGDVSREDAQKARAIGGASYSESAEDSQRYGSSRSESRRHSYGRRTSSQGSSRDGAQGRSYESRAIGGTGSSRGADSQYPSGSRSSSRRFSQERSGSSRSSSRDSEEPPYADFGPGGGPEQQSWFPGTSRTTVGTGVPDLSSSSTSRAGGFGFGAVGEALGEDGSSGRTSGAQVRAGGGTNAAGDGEVLFRDRQTYANSAEARRPGSIAGGDSSQHAAFNTSWSSSGERQVTAYDASSASRPEGTEVRFLTSYTPTQGEGAYTSMNNQQSRGSNRHRSRHSNNGSRTSRRRAVMRRRQRVTDTVSSISGGESAPLSRFFEIDQHNDTVYEVDGKQRYSYYWEVNDLPTMMTTWEHHHSLRSPSFYVFKGGYRMYIRVFPSRQGGNVYLHTGLTQGRHDDQLSWPFTMRLRLSLLDHSNLQHDIRSRVWDPRKLCSRWNWQRPRRRDNFECVGLGFPQSLLETQRFLLDGAVLIKLDVFLEDED